MKDLTLHKEFEDNVKIIEEILGYKPVAWENIKAYVSQLEDEKQRLIEDLAGEDL